MTESAFFQDLALQMFAAGVVAVLFMRLGWPKVIGYILAGVFMSQYTWGGSLLHSVGAAQALGRLGVVFLMFGMGLSFSAKEMAKIRSVALPAAVLDVAVMAGIGYFLGERCFGWGATQALFLGVAICDSATTMLAKVIDEMGWGRRPFVRYALGTSVCEDVATVGAIALATGFALGGGMSAGALLSSLGWLAVFFLTVLVFGYILLPRLLDSIGRRRDDETLLLTMLGVCFIVSFVAEKFEFSLALGAFLVGIIAASSEFRHRLEKLSNPLKSMFSAVFFISIGLMVDPAAIWNCWPQILAVSAVIVIGKTVNVTLASLAAGLEFKTAVQSGIALAQVGEFALMTAMLYSALCPGDGHGPIFEVAVGASLLTTMVNPWLIRRSGTVAEWLERRLSVRCRERLATYQAWLEKIRRADQSPAYRKLRTEIAKLSVYAVLMFSVSVVCALLHRFDYSRFSEFAERHDEVIFFFAFNLFAVALMPLPVSSSRALADAAMELLANGGSAKWRLSVRPLIRFVLLVAVLSLFFLEWSAVNVIVLPVSAGLLGASAVFVALAAVAGWRFFVKAGRRASQRFQDALTADERREGMARMMTVTVPEGTIHELLLTDTSPAIGGTVVSLNVRAKTGASIVSVRRGGRIVRNIGPEWEFQSGDVAVALGDSRQIAALKDLFGVTSENP